MSHQSDLIATDINAYLKQHEEKELLRFLTCGNVDDGKSTLIGRLLHDSKMIYEDQLEAIKKDSVKSGTTGDKVDLALLVDGLQAEREQGITIDVAYRYFSTAKRKFIIADTPGHEQYTRNMATGASTCDLAIILIDARHGVQTQTKRHSFIANLLGIKNIIVAINKMDLVDFSEDRFSEIKREYLDFAEKLGIQSPHFVPLSALNGDNVVDKSVSTPWYSGQTLMEALETIDISKGQADKTLRYPVQYVNRPNLNYRGYCGTIASGTVKKGDEVMVLPSKKTSTVKAIDTYDGELEQAFAPMAITITLNDEIDISRGDMIVHADKPMTPHQRFNAKIVWMTEDHLQPGKQYSIKHTTKLVTGTVTKIHNLIDVNTLEKSQAPHLQLNEIADCELSLSQALMCDPYAELPHSGAFIIIDRLTNVTVGAGMITSFAEQSQLSEVSSEERQARLNQKPALIALTGQQSAAIAKQVERLLFDTGYQVACLCQQEITTPDQFEGIAKLSESAGLITLCAADVPEGLATLSIDTDTLEHASDVLDMLTKAQLI